MFRTSVVLTGVILGAAWVGAQARDAAGIASAAERAAAAEIRSERLRAHVRFLADDLLEGRGPATRGDRLAQLYVAAQMEALGLEPGAPDGSFFQPVDIVGVTSRPAGPLRLRRGDTTLDLKPQDDFIAFSGVLKDAARVDEAEVVFVGYGIVAPEFQWDDYKDADLEGKVLLMLNNDPEDDPRLFAGQTRLYYGRWDYKYEMAAKRGAAAAVIVHTTHSAGYAWQVVRTSWSGEQFHLPEEDAQSVAIKAWATEDAARRLTRLGGHELEALVAAAQRRDFRPVPLGVGLSLALDNDLRRAQTANVLGRLPGRDPRLAAQAVIFTAHHDHLGRKPGLKPGQDSIYNGALDNASGVSALLNLAQAMTALAERPRRSLLFAAVAAEEQGLLGSKYLARHLPLPAGRLAADINLDGLNVFGRTRDVPVIGLGKSSLDDDLLALARRQGRVVVPDPFPDRGFFYRSDQLSFARIGVPAAYLDAGVEVIGKPAGWGKQQQEKYEATDYHQPTDELRPDWDLSGAVEDVQLLFYLGLRVANAEHPPAWKPGDEFEAARKESLKALGE